MVTLGTRGVAVDPLASQTEIVSRLSADVVVAEVVVEGLWVGVSKSAGFPLTLVLGGGSCCGGGSGSVVGSGL